MKLEKQGSFTFRKKSQNFNTTAIETKEVLYRTRCYLVGHMEYANGEDWRKKVEKRLSKLGIISFNPYKKPFIKDVEEGEGFRLHLRRQMALGNYAEVQDKMHQIRIYDLNLVDRSDFIIAHIIPNVASWGSAEELVTAVRMKKPTFISIEGGRKNTPLWLLGMFPSKYFYDSVEKALEMVEKINTGEKQIDSDRWRLLRKELR